MSPLQFVILAILLALAIATAIPEMGASNIARVFRGDCTFAGFGRIPHIYCPPARHAAAARTSTVR